MEVVKANVKIFQGWNIEYHIGEVARKFIITNIEFMEEAEVAKRGREGPTKSVRV